MIWALLAAYLTKRPPWVQAVVFGLCTGLFVTAGAESNTREPVISSMILLVLLVGIITGALFLAGLRADRRSRRDVDGAPAWVHVAYAGAWLLSIVAAVLALFGAGGLPVAVLAIVPIVLLAPPALTGLPALLGMRALSGRAP